MSGLTKLGSSVLCVGNQLYELMSLIIIGFSLIEFLNFFDHKTHEVLQLLRVVP